MKKQYIVYLLVGVFTLGACDEVDGPYRDPDSYGRNNDGNLDERVQKVVLEEFTGFRCQTCPAATDLAQNLKASNPEQVILISVHSGFFARVIGEPYTYDFNTPEGTELDQAFSVSAAGTPNGLVNRTEFDGERILTPASWNTRVAELLQQEAPLKIELTTEYNEGTRMVNVDAKITYFEDGSANDYISLYLLENNFVEVQLDERKTPKPLVDYSHQHVLRTSFNGTFGDPVASAAPATGDVIERSWSVAVDEGWNSEELEVVAIVHEFQTSNRILQAEAVHVGEE